ncbi:MAG: hypothetical protein ACO3QA_05980 [Phycisphaerales bacterium]
MKAFDTPIALVLFNRPDRLAEVVSAIRETRPRRIVAIADGPRPDRPDDVDRCRAARAVLDAIDWPCEIERDFADSNLGCDRRIRTGLDRLFDRHDAAIVLEDDVRPDPSFLPWAAAMLDRYGTDPDFAIASGCNKLGRWGDQELDHLRARRGSIWGWASTAEVWRDVWGSDPAGLEANLEDDALLDGHEPLMIRQSRLVFDDIRAGHAIAWDTEFSARLQLMGRIAAISTVNLVSNLGIGADATRTTYAGDFVATIASTGVAAPPSDVRPELDPAYDRASLLAELLGRCVHPEMAVRLARLAVENPRAPIDEATRLHLEPFMVPGEALEVTDRLADHGVRSPQFERVRAALRRARDLQTTERSP